MRMALSRDFDGMAVVVDWLDACRNQNLEQLLDAYASDAGLECACEGVSIGGRAALAAYWKPKLTAFAPAAFGIEEITPDGDAVLLDYLNFQGKPVRIRFAFDAEGKIAQSRCEPAPPGG
jgi:ketosteroid isomerase-like protein